MNTLESPDVYSNIAPGGSDTAAPMNLQKRLEVVTACAPAGSRILDCGCGAGSYVSRLRELGYRAWGVEFFKEKLIPGSDAGVRGHAVVGDLLRIPLADESVDVVVMNEVIEHVPDDLKALHEIKRVLRSNGTLVLMAPNRFHPFETHAAHLKGSGRAIPHYVPFVPYLPLRLAECVMTFWARNYWPSELRSLVRKSGFQIRQNGFVWQTFEGISQAQPTIVTRLRPLLRRMSAVFERVPGLRAFGVSQLIIAAKHGRMTSFASGE